MGASRVGAALVAGVLLTGCSLVSARTSAVNDEASPKSSSARPTVTKKSPAPSPTTEPAESPEPSREPEPSPTPEPSDPPSAEGGGGLTPVWYPDWSPSGGRGEAAGWLAEWPRPVVLEPTGSGPLDGRTIAVDPGHNLGNAVFGEQINRTYWVGLEKICNTTGTSTASGYPEASYTFDVAERLAARLTADGATVVLTRGRNDEQSYGPCIQARGLLGGQAGADIEVSIHADGGPAGGRGAFAYTPGVYEGYTDSDKAERSVRLATSLLAGLAESGIAGSTYLRPNVSPNTEQGTLNVAEVPIVILETLNMRNARDAAIAESEEGRQSVADGIYTGIRGYFDGG